jgi:hypothetical protein
VEGYTVASTGKLTAVPGSPFSENVGSLTTNGKFLWGVNNNGLYIDAYKIASSGALAYATQIDAAKNNSPSNCGTEGTITLNHTGATLYMMMFDAINCANNAYQSYTVNTSTGGLTYTGFVVGGAFPPVVYSPTFTANNLYAYTAFNDSDMYFAIYGFKRASNGKLTKLSYQPSTPKPASNAGFSGYCPDSASADTSEHVAIMMYPCNPPGGAAGKPAIASYTSASNGDLTTTNTGPQMPVASLSFVNSMRTSPAGNLLAIGGIGGLQVFHYNGAKPLTHYTGLPTTAQINQVTWDNNNHLFAVSKSAGKLYVFNVTTSGYSQATGSPYSIPGAQYIVVRPAPWY